ncbi:MAG TPA: hypothetical protein PLY68_04455 [Myxococcota bacterium]|nr:metallophosphoesterase [Myxococcota bacterium]HPB50348.1 hypothetical protein [Myxococcota bacterium]HQP95430.1 hypothetical protein [Myxococcota bacterium]
MADTGTTSLSEVKVIFSDTHLGSGHAPGIVNPFEDFHHDDKLAELIDHHCSGRFADVPVELFINGDFLDTLKVPWEGTFPTEVTEPIAAAKVARCVRGHPAVFDALRRFISVPDHRVTINPGNHDIDIVFPGAQRVIRARLGVPEDSQAVTFVTDREFTRFPMGVIVCHGNGFETMNRIEPGRATRKTDDGREVLDLPIGSRFVLDCLMPVKRENQLIDHVVPLSTYLMYGLVFETRFTVRLLGRSIRFFLQAPMGGQDQEELSLVKKIQLALENISLFSDFEKQAFKTVKGLEEFSTLITGHSHKAMIRRFPGNRTYVNTGTWTRTVRLELGDLGPVDKLTYALVEYPTKGPPSVNLMAFNGTRRVTEALST